MPYYTKKETNGRVGIYRMADRQKVGESDTAAKAEASIRARMADEHKSK